MKKIEIFGLQTIPQIKPGDNLPQIIIDSAQNEIGGLQPGDILILTSKIISKAMGLLKKKSDVKVTANSLAVAKRTGKDPVWVQMIKDEGHGVAGVIPLNSFFRNHAMDSAKDARTGEKLCDQEQCIFLTFSPNGSIHTCDAGIDGSNHPDDIVSFIPPDPDEAAEAVREDIMGATGEELAVILADTELMPFGTMDFAVGSSGIEPRTKEFGRSDMFGKPKFGGTDLIVHELTAAAALHFGQADTGIPACIVRGYKYNVTNTENIANTIWTSPDKQHTRQVIKEVIRATAGARPLLQRLLLRLAAWFV
ncbi:MAG: coenzyme F420-0:L-glutamate ligase [Planctomycetota bacterium]|jgi:coenzyme F420-0:L-glutamate ligase/coenzyme F420-1:gamma-L-glutamate ligase